MAQFPVLPLPLLFDCPLAPQQIVTRSSGWNLPPWSGTALQDPRTASVAADGVYVNTRDWTLQTRRLQLWWFLLRYSGNPGIITMPFAIYLIKMEKHGFSQFVRNFSPSIVSSHKKEQCVVTRPLAGLYSYHEQPVVVVDLCVAIIHLNIFRGSWVLKFASK